MYARVHVRACVYARVHECVCGGMRDGLTQRHYHSDTDFHQTRAIGDMPYRITGISPRMSLLSLALLFTMQRTER